MSKSKIQPKIKKKFKIIIPGKRLKIWPICLPQKKKQKKSAADI